MAMIPLLAETQCSLNQLAFFHFIKYTHIGIHKYIHKHMYICMIL